ncbi:MAG TPA: nucleotidyl transferase AbiEii/AbiGii toxin family protein [Candidatus Acidoferrum sp.]|nr:nucleotidyl transferase AbiEii/AbiGii toxin family protein [Candidatus Acidoferrum sp.]
MANAIEITKDFPASRERAVLLELLNVMKTLKQAQIEGVICGGWVPFLKELARHSQTDHTMSLDIDLLLRARARERETIDRIKDLLSDPLDFERSNTESFRYEKSIDGNVVQLDLLADLPRTKEDESIIKVHGAKTSLDLCPVDGAEDLNDHVETIQINCRKGEHVETFEIAVPNATGFLILKTTVCRYREKPKDAYDIYYYCRYSEDSAAIRQMLASSIHVPAVARTVDALKRMFTHQDSKWVDMVLDHMNISGDDRDREAQYVVRSISRVIEGL